MTRLTKYLRLLPAIMALGGTLFVVKAAGLVRDAQAQVPATTPAPAATQSVTAVRIASDADDAESSSSEVDVLTSLSKRRAELDRRERELDTQQALIAAAEKRVDDKIAGLKSLQSQIQNLLVQRDAAQQKQIEALVKTYSAMKPRDAARIFNSVDETVLIAVASQMKPDVLAPILALMQSENAQKLTLKLADRLKLPDPAPTPPVQTALAQPASTPTPASPVASPASPPGAPPMAATVPPVPPPAAASSSAAPVVAKPLAAATNAPAASGK